MSYILNDILYPFTYNIINITKDWKHFCVIKNSENQFVITDGSNEKIHIVIIDCTNEMREWLDMVERFSKFSQLYIRKHIQYDNRKQKYILYSEDEEGYITI